MKKFIATISWLMITTASLGEAGQHSGVGGNPAVPPPTPSSIVVPSFVVQTVQPGVVIFIPDFDGQDQASDEKSIEDNTGDESSK